MERPSVIVRSATSTINRTDTQTVPKSKILDGLHVAFQIVQRSTVNGRIGRMHHLDELFDESLREACNCINEANEYLLSIGADDSSEFEQVFQGYAFGYDFITSVLTGHVTEPNAIPETFLGSWARFKHSSDQEARAPWFIVATALAWAQCVGRMWIARPQEDVLAKEARCIFREMADYNNDATLLGYLERVSDDEFRLSLDHLFKNGPPRNTFDRSIQNTIDWAMMQLRRERMRDDQICREIATLENVLRYAIVYATKDAIMSIHELDQSSIENMTLDRFVALYLIGPRRLVARLSDPQFIPNDEKHTRILRELCGKVSEQMGHSVMATAAAKRTEELISHHRQDIWSNGAAMVPGIQQEGVPSVSDGVSVYQPSILDGSWTAGENVEDVDSEIDESDQEYHNDQIHLESQEEDGEISDDNGEMFQLLQEREASETTKYMPGMLPASKFLTPSETSDSHSIYAPSSLSRFSKATKQREPTMVEDTTLSNDDGYDERSTYTVSSLSKHPNPERHNAPPVLDSSLHHHGQPRLISAEQMSRRDDEELTQYNPSEFSEFTMPRPLPLINTDANHLSFLPSIGEDEDDDDPIRSMASAGIEQTAQWVAGAIASTQDDQNIVQEGAATNALMVDNERLAQTLSVHRASEHGLTFVLTQAQKELGQTTAQLVEQREITDRLRQTLDEQNIKF